MREASSRGPSWVPYDALDYTDEWVYAYEGELFTGVGYEETEDGRLESETPIVEGKEHGLARGYYSSGRLAGETPYVRGRKHGLRREWDEDGRLREEAHLEFDVLMRRRRFSADGTLVDEWVRPPDDPLYRRVLEQRESES